MDRKKKQREFISRYYRALKSKNKAATDEDIANVCIVLYLEAEDDAEKERAAYFLLTIFPVHELFRLEELLDVEELYGYASAKQRKVKNTARQAHEKRHQNRGDYSLTETEWEKAIQHFGHECAYCGEKKKLTFEHVVPFSKGGSFGRENIIPACPACNASKNDLDFHDWFTRQPFYDERRKQRIVNYLKQSHYQGHS